MGDICRMYDLPSDFVLSNLIPQLNGTLNSQKDTILTASHLRRLESRLRGYLTAATMPLSMSPFYQGKTGFSLLIVNIRFWRLEELNFQN